MRSSSNSSVGRRSFISDTRGSVAIISGFCMIALLGLAGLAIDYGQMISLRNRAQGALDAAVLAASNPLLANESRQTTFAATFSQNYGSGRISPSTLKFDYGTSTGGVGSATFQYTTLFMGVMGESAAQIGVVSKARIDVADLEIVFALDISGSMQAMDMGGGSRLDALKSSVRNLMDVILANRAPGQSIKFGVVPFNMAVNIGTDNVGLVDNTKNALFAGSTWGGCVLERKGGFQAKDVYNPGATDGSGRWPAYIWPPAPNQGPVCLNRSNGTNGGYSSVEPAPLGKDPWRDGPNFNCPRYPLVRLSSSDSDIRNAVNGLVAYGNMGTTIGPAVGWGLRMLSPDGPFRDGAAFSYKTRKLLIVVTDGELVTDGGNCAGATNSITPYEFDPTTLGLAGRKMTSAPVNDSFTPYGYILDSDPYNSGLISALDADKELDRLAIQACDDVKNRKTGEGAIQVYTIAASTGAAPATRAGNVLSNCASDASSFIYAADATALDAAFKKIGEDVLKLRLTQ